MDNRAEEIVDLLFELEAELDRTRNVDRRYSIQGEMEELSTELEQLETDAGEFLV
jgi:hypothetical protein